MELTNNEKKVLLTISFNADDIESGNLGDDDMAMLLEMRKVAEYLKGKYPDHALEITGCDPKTGTIKTYNEWLFCRANDDSSPVYSAYAEKTDDQLDIKDNFFAELVKAPIEAYIRDTLTDSSLPVLEVTAGFWEHLGKEFGEDISYKDVLSGAVPAGNDIKIFLDGSALTNTSFSETTDKAKESLTDANVTGDIYIVILKDKESDHARDRLFSADFTLDM